MNTEEIKELISRRRRQILVHSFIYYRMNTNIIDDYTFDKWSRELADLQSKHPDIANECVFSDGFSDFDGSSGFNLPLGDTWVHDKALYLLRIHEENL